jgi:hypothetical protein
MIDESRVKEIKLKAGMFAQMGGQDNLIFAECISDMLNDRKERIEIEKQKDKEIELLREVFDICHKLYLGDETLLYWDNESIKKEAMKVSFNEFLNSQEKLKKALKAYHDWKESNGSE